MVSKKKIIMVDFKPPIDPIEPIKKNRIEAVDQKKEEDQNEKWAAYRTSEKKESFIFSVFESISQIFTKFLPRSYSGQSIQKLDESIDAFILALKKLEEEDLSQDSDFLKELSDKWHQVTEGNKTSFLNKHPPENLERALTAINAYPAGQEFSLGYYLTEYAGFKWIPFPFIDIVQTLHLQFKQNPLKNPLTEWIVLLEKAKEELS